MGRVFICITLSATSACMILDDPPGAGSSIIVTPPDKLFTSEGVYEERVFQVRLATEPDAEVRLPVEVFPPEEAVGSTTELVFTPESWDQPQQLVVTSVDDGPGGPDGAQPYRVILSPLESADLDFAGIDPPDYEMVNYDADVEIKLFDPADPAMEQRPGLLIYEQTLLPDGSFGARGTSFGVRLTGEVREGTSVTLAFDLVGADGDASFPSEEGVEQHHHEITFTPETWDTPQVVDIVSLDDDVVDADAITMEISVITEDPVYNRLINPEPIAQADDEIFGITTSPTSTNLCEGDLQTVVVALNRPPLDSVRIDYTSSRGDLEVSGSPLLLSAEQMSSGMILTAIENGVVQENRVIGVEGGVTTSDPNYVAEPASAITVTIIDDDGQAAQTGETGTAETPAFVQIELGCGLNPI